MKAILIISCFFAVAMAAPAAQDHRTLKEELLSLLRKELLQEKEDSEPIGVRTFTTSLFFSKVTFLKLLFGSNPIPTGVKTFTTSFLTFLNSLFGSGTKSNKAERYSVGVKSFILSSNTVKSIKISDIKHLH